MIDGRRFAVRKLERLRATYQRKLDKVDRKIAALSGSGRGGGRRARNETNLSDAIAGVLSRASAPLRVGDIMAKVQAAGYRSGSANFRGMVNIALIKDRRFVREGRGVYRLRGTSNTKANLHAPKRGSKSRVEKTAGERNGAPTAS
jgi:hypothetical protein